ncbi:HlyC/CorC family transporter [bacterium]|nr:MAG: HlyC/CorC family transporter [bacterium]
MAALYLALAVFLVLLNGFFVAAEFALVKVRPTQLQEQAAKGSAAARLALYASEHLDAYLSATQLGITLASIGLGWVGEPGVGMLLEPTLAGWGVSEKAIEGISFGVAFTLVSMFHIVLGELAPKSWAIQRPESLTLLIIRPLHYFYLAFRPIIGALNGLAGLVLRPFGMHNAGGHGDAHSEDELRMLVMASGVSGVLNETEVEIAGHVLGFSDRTVRDVMVPRVEMVSLDVTRPLEEAIEITRRNPFSRYPLVNGDHDDVVGVVHVKELFLLAVGGEGDLRSVSRETLRVPTTKPLDQMLREFQRTRVHMAVVSDEHGGTEGVITLEDVLEELVGEIADEHDAPEKTFEETGEREWTVPASARLTRLSETVGARLESEEHDTIGGLVFELLGRMPRAGDTVHVPGAELHVIEADGRRARKVRIRVL